MSLCRPRRRKHNKTNAQTPHTNETLSHHACEHNASAAALSNPPTPASTRTAAAATAASSTHHLADAAASPAAVGRARALTAAVLPAGFSIERVDPAAAQSASHSWAPLEAETFRVRCGPDYKRYGRKEASRPAHGEVVAMDCVRTKGKMMHIMQRGFIELPEPSPNWSESYPEFLVINQCLPAQFHFRLIPTESADGETYHVLTYVRLRAGLAAGWDGEGEPSGPEELFKRFMLRADVDDKVANGLKEIGVVQNLGELSRYLPSGIRGLLTKFNGKPILTRPEQKFFRGPQNRYLEVDLDCHRYSLSTRTAVSQLLKHIGRTEMGFGLVVEARTEKQLPETMAFCCTILRLTKERVPDFPPSEAKEPAPPSIADSDAVALLADAS